MKLLWELKFFLVVCEFSWKFYHGLFVFLNTRDYVHCMALALSSPLRVSSVTCLYNFLLLICLYFLSFDGVFSLFAKFMWFCQQFYTLWFLPYAEGSFVTSFLVINVSCIGLYLCSSLNGRYIEFRRLGLSWVRGRTSHRAGGTPMALGTSINSSPSFLGVWFL